jgi:hypothetical protein
MVDTLEKVIDMQKQGMNDGEISTNLQNEGVSPKDIDNSLNQARVKNAVSPPGPIGAPTAPSAQPPAQAPQTGTSPAPEMQASMMGNGGQEGGAPMPTAAPPAPTGPPAAAPMEPPMAPGPEVYPPQGQDQQQDYYYPETPQAYPAEDYYAPQGGMDTETISEIAEQVATEKLNEFKAKTGDLVSFKNAIQERVEDIDDRLKRIESSIDKLQQAIIGKIGEFGESNAMIHKDLDNLHGTVSKLMNPLIDNVNELKKIAK